MATKIPKKIKEEAEEENETPESEMAEHEVGAEEKEEGTPEHEDGVAGKEDGETSGSADVPEEFQAEAQQLLSACDSIHCLDYLSSKISEKRSELMKEEGPATPQSFSTEEMPS